VQFLRSRGDRATRLALALCGHYLAGVSQRTRPKKPANLRSWRVIIMRSRAANISALSKRLIAIGPKQ